MTNDLAVKKSKIEGKGVFADRDFKKGEIIIKWNISHQLAPEEAKKLPESEKRLLVYFREKNILITPVMQIRMLKIFATLQSGISGKEKKLLLIIQKQ